MSMHVKNKFFKQLSSALTSRRGGLEKEGLSPANWQEQAQQQREKIFSKTNDEDLVQALTHHLTNQSAQVKHVPNKTAIYDELVTIVTTWNKAQAGTDQKANRIVSGKNPFINSLFENQNSDLTLNPWQGQASLQEDGLIALATASAAASETGTLFLTSGNENPTPLNFVTDCHVILLNQADIFASYEQAYHHALAQNKSHSNTMPRTINMISGPSRTADIEQTLTLGAHGPIELVVLIYKT